MNSNKPQNTGRQPSQSGGSASVTNTGRKSGNAALNTISARSQVNLQRALMAGRQQIHEDSATRLRDERVAIYDKMNAYSMGGKAMDSAKGKAKSWENKAWSSPVGRALQNSSLVGDHASKRADKIVQQKADRKNARVESATLQPMQQRMEGLNKGAITAERTGDAMLAVKRGATIANHVGTGVSLVAPQVGLGIKAAAKGTKLAANLGAATSFQVAKGSYEENAKQRESSTGMGMFDHHISAEKAKLMGNQRNATLKKTAVSATIGAAGFGIEEAAELGVKAFSTAVDASAKTANALQQGTKATLGVAEYFGKDALKERAAKSSKDLIKENKAELVNLMQHQRSYAAHKERQMGMTKAVTGRAKK